LFSKISSAYWLMDDGYFDSHGRTQTVLICTESFTKEECIILQSVLEKLDIKSTLKVRYKLTIAIELENLKLVCIKWFI
jgi:LAGLIDADG DNA endonuclease family